MEALDNVSLSPQPLLGVRVAEIGDGVAVAAAGKQFADFGAEVVKIEPIDGGELRRLPPFYRDRPNIETGGFHLSLDTGKQSLALDLRSPSGREVVTRLSANTEVLLVELPPDLAGRVLSAARTAESAPSTVAITPHGLDGPYRDRREFDMSLFGWSTTMMKHRVSGEPPLRYAPETSNMQVGITAAAVALARCVGAPRRRCTP